MMKRLTKSTIDELRNEMPVLDEETLRMILGGNSDGQRTDCFFQCAYYLYSGFGGKAEGVNADSMGDAYYDQLKKNSGKDDERGCGMLMINADATMAGWFDCEVMDKDQVKAGELNKDHQYMALSQGGEHAIIINGYNKIGYYSFTDPQSGASGVINPADITKMYDVSGTTLRK